MQESVPVLGVAVVVVKDGKILLGEDHTKGDNLYYGVPGGHLESGESLAEAARREVVEEAGVEINGLKLISVYEFFRKDKKRTYITIGFKAEWKSGKPKDESDSTRKNWAWFGLDELPEKIFPPDRILIERSKSGVVWE